MRRRDLPLYLAGASATLAALPARAATEGRDYHRLPQAQPVAVPGKIEVIEFFGYWCPHCSALEPELEAWARKLPADVILRRMPVAFRPSEDVLQRLYFGIESLGWVDQLHRKVFGAVHVQRLPLRTDAEAAAFAKSQGLDDAKLLDAMKSFSVATKVRQAKQLAENYKLDAVPTLFVQGRYKTSVADAGGPARLFPVLDDLIALARKG